MGYIADFSKWIGGFYDDAEIGFLYAIGENKHLNYQQYNAIKKAQAALKEANKQVPEWVEITAAADQNTSEGLTIFSQVYGLKSALNLSNKLSKIMTAPAVVGALVAFGKAAEDEIKAIFKEIFGRTVESIEPEELKKTAGIAAAEIFNQQLKERYGITSPITNFYSEYLIDEIGAWGAVLINQQISKATKQELNIFTSILPPAQIKTDLEAFLPQAGEMGAAYLNQLLSKLTNQNLTPFTTLYPIETVKEDLLIFAPSAGEAVAKEINQEASKLLKKEVHIISTVYPLENVVSEIDAFITGFVNDALKINLSGIMQNRSIKSELQAQVTGLIAHLVTEKISEAKLTLIADLQAKGLPANELAELTIAVTSYATKIMQMLDSYKINGLRGNFFGYYSQNKAKINNRARQRKYRTKYREDRQWVLR